jgi:protein-glutamine gamma-glutamyltransferase
MTATPERSRWIELVCFAALACFVALEWTDVVADPPSGRATFAVAVATGAGAALIWLGQRRDSRPVRWALAGGVALAAVLAGLVIVGLPARLLLPIHWGELASNLDRSLQGIADVPVPYAGTDPWTRLAILLAAPLVVGLAAMAAFWPRRRRPGRGRIEALVLLVGLYLVAVAWVRPDRQLADGALLLVLVCAFLWLPGLQNGNRWRALAAVVAAGAVALPAAVAINPNRPLLDYRHWNLLSAQGQSFHWDHSYGPLDWPQQGRLLVEVASERSHYWKATNLDSFDGVRWIRSYVSGEEPALGEPLKFHPKGAPPRPNPEWIDRVNFRIKGLTSDSALGAGTVLALNRVQARPSQDGIWDMTEELAPGDDYTALVYDPKPSPDEMQAAGTDYPVEANRYVEFALADGGALPRSVHPELWGRSGPPAIESQIAGTPYQGMYELARRVTAGAATPYEAASRIQDYLRGHLAYKQDVPNHAYPLPAFLADDHAGYCQQFSGAMALMLRMLGIPSRVSAGFATGGRGSRTTNFLVDDTDAHDWVEVFFPAIGWVTFEPTPAAAPAETQIDDGTLGVSKPDVNGGPATPLDISDPGGANQSQPKGTPETKVGPKAGASGGGGLPIVAAVVGVLLLSGIGLYGYRRIRTARLDDDELAGAELRELERALARLGSPLPAGATLLTAEKELARLGGPPAATYAAELRERRYRRAAKSPPSLAERRSLRRALRRGPTRWAPNRPSSLAVLRAFPPGGPALRA